MIPPAEAPAVQLYYLLQIQGPAPNAGAASSKNRTFTLCPSAHREAVLEQKVCSTNTATYQQLKVPLVASVLSFKHLLSANNCAQT